MTTHTWILVGLAAVLSLIVTTAFFGLRAYRPKLNRGLMLPFISHVVMWSFFALMFFDGMIRILMLAAVVGIYAPCFYWILKSPRNSRAA